MRTFIGIDDIDKPALIIIETAHNKSQQTPKTELDTARSRLKNSRGRNSEQAAGW